MDETLLTNLRSAYNQSAENRDRAIRQEWKLLERKKFLRYLEAQKARRLLEIGAGPGRDSLFFQNHGLDVTATDLSPEMVRLCQEKGLNAYEMGFEELEFAKPFDAIYALNCLLHVPKMNLPVILQRLQSLLKPEGLFYMGVYGGDDFEGIYENDYHEPKRFFSFYTSEKIQDVVGQFFRLVHYQEIPVKNREHIFQSMIWQHSIESN